MNTLAAFVFCLALSSANGPLSGNHRPWPRHPIGAGTGADGIRLSDMNGDGLPDAAVGFEEEGLTRLYSNPGPARVKAPWPSLTLGTTPDIEDASIADLDDDGRKDVISLTEGRDRSIHLFFAPAAVTEHNGQWRHIVLGDGIRVPRMAYMFAQAVDLDGDGRVEIVVGGKDNAKLGILHANGDRRSAENWRFRPLRDVGWTMSILAEDMDGDGDADILLSDRKPLSDGTDLRGIHWLENPGDEDLHGSADWQSYLVGMRGEETMFIASADIDGDGYRDVVAASKDSSVPSVFFGLDRRGRAFHRMTPEAPPSANFGTGKAVIAADFDGDGRLELAISAESADGAKIGIAVWSATGDSRNPASWSMRGISGEAGIKFDLLVAHDLDADGDPDILSTEESEGGGGLGVVWYENPRR